MRACCSVGFAASSVALVFAMTAATDLHADEASSVAQRCIYVDRLDRTRVVDERSILFFMRDHSVLQNVLPKACVGLRKSDPIAYDVVNNKLCANELVRQLVGAGVYSRGAVCPLGMFVPIGPDEVDRLLPTREKRRDQPSGTPTIESKPVP